MSIVGRFAAPALNAFMIVKTIGSWTAMIVQETVIVMMANVYAKMVGKERLVKKLLVQTIVPVMALVSWTFKKAQCVTAMTNLQP